MRNWIQLICYRLRDWSEVRNNKNAPRLGGKIFQERSWLERQVADAIFEASRRRVL